jgi:Ca-activated chloride channel family protein
MKAPFSISGSLLVAVFAVAVPLFAQSQNAPKNVPPGTPAASPAQAAPPSQQAAPKPVPIIVRTENVIVPVTVKDSRGQLVGDLQKEDFRILVDGVEQKILRFSSEPVPLSAVVLVDNDLEQKQAGDVQRSLLAIAAGFGPSDEVALVSYEAFPKTLLDFSFNNDDLFTQLKRLDLSSHPAATVSTPTTMAPSLNGQPLPTGAGLPQHGSGRYQKISSLNDALYNANDMLKTRSRERRKIIFLVSDMTNSSNVHTLEETLHALEINDVSVYSISVVHSLPIGKSVVQRGAEQVERYATDTGGDTYYASKQEDLERLYSNVTEQARNQYTLTFSPQDVDRTRDFHSIDVRVRRAGLDIVTRQGYFQSAYTIGH